MNGASIVAQAATAKARMMLCRDTCPEWPLRHICDHHNVMIYSLDKMCILYHNLSLRKNDRPQHC